MNMLFFRSEEFLNEWLESKKAARGATLSVEQVWKLSKRWYHNRLSLEYHGRSVDQIQKIFREIGLTDPFWQAG
jgi:hypothetical protein